MADNYTTFGNYLLLKQRSKDGLGTLWRAGEMERTGFKRIVWLRRLDQLGAERGAPHELAAANQTSLVAKASNIARNATYARDKGMLYIAWDYVPAQPLDQLLERVIQEQFPVAIDNALLIAEKICAALASALGVDAGGGGLLHGFLLPHLVMIGNDGEAMVTGFGISRQFLAGRDKPVVKPTVAPYLAPEVLAGGGPSKRGDVYSLGAILYHLLCGMALPVEPAERSAVLVQPGLAFEEGPVPQDVLGILQKSLADRPEERYGSAADFKRELEKLLYGGAYSPTTFNLALFMDRLYRNDIEQEDRELQRERTLDVGAYYQAPKAAGTPEASLPSEASAPASKTGLYAAIGGAAVLIGVIIFLLVGRGGGGGGGDQSALIQREVAKQLGVWSQQMDALKAQGDKDRAEADRLRKELDDARKAPASGAPKLTAEQERAKQEELKRKADELAKKDEERKQREQEMAKIEANMARLAAQAPSVATRVPATVTPVPPTAVPALQQPTAAAATVPTVAAPVVVPTAVVAAPTVVAQVPPVRTQAPPPEVPGLPGGAVNTNDFVKPELVDTPPQILSEEKPVLPRTALMSRTPQDGSVILRATVNANGTVDEVAVLRPFPGSVSGVDDACVEALKKYRFKPGTKGGVKVKTYHTVTFRVTIKGR